MIFLVVIIVNYGKSWILLLILRLTLVWIVSGYCVYGCMYWACVNANALIICVLCCWLWNPVLEVALPLRSIVRLLTVAWHFFVTWTIWTHNRQANSGLFGHSLFISLLACVKWPVFHHDSTVMYTCSKTSSLCGNFWELKVGYGLIGCVFASLLILIPNSKLQVPCCVCNHQKIKTRFGSTTRGFVLSNTSIIWPIQKQNSWSWLENLK